MNKKRAMFWSVVSGILCCVVALPAHNYLTLPYFKPYNKGSFFPNKISEVVALTGDKEIMRCVNQDPRTNRENFAKILYTDGEVKLIYYSNNRTVSRVTSYYQQQDVTCQSVDFSHLKSDTFINKNGKTVLSSRTYDTNRLLTLKADRDETSGGLTELRFFPGTQNLSRQRFWDSNDVLWSDESLHKNKYPTLKIGLQKYLVFWTNLWFIFKL